MSGLIKSREFKYPTGEFYVHFPYSGSDIYSWGQNTQYQCGNPDVNNTTPSMIDDLHANDIKTISAGDNHTIILSKKGVLRSCGSGN